MTTSFDKLTWLCCTNYVKYILISLLSIFATSISYSNIRVTSVAGASYSELNSSGFVSIIYGGKSGTCNSTSPNSTCNSCVSTSNSPIESCNPTSIHSTLQMSVTLSVSTTVIGQDIDYILGITSNGTTIDDSVTGSVTAAETMTIAGLTWGDICGSDGNFDSNCDATASGTIVTSTSGRALYVALDLNDDGDTADANEITTVPIKISYVGANVANHTQNYCTPTGDSSLKGFCGYVVRPGDQKVKIDVYPATSALPTATGDSTGWYGVAFIHRAGASAASDVANNSSTPIIRQYNSSLELSNDVVDGLQNGTQYCFAMGNVNKAQNIFLFSISGSSPADVCAVPSEVVGLLDDKSCFISTAAFGSDMATEVQTFRNFRDHFLLRSDLGRLFVKTYYKYSPPLANIISESEILKFIARLFLYPLYFFSLISLKWGYLEALFILVGLIVLISRFKKIIFSKKINFIWIFLIFGFYAHDSSAQLRETKKTRHVGAAQGLTRIDKDGNYIYKTDISNTRETSHFKIGGAGHPEVTTDITSPDGSQVESVTFDDVYPNASALAFEYSYEYFMIKHGGKIGGHLSAGFQVAQGKGRLVNDPSQESFETFTFLTMPINVGLVYRFEYTDRQILVPYVVGGGSVMILAEKREDRSKVNAIGGFGFFAAGGGLLNLTAFDRDMASDLAAEYDIKNLWLSAEFKYLNVTNDAFIYDSGYVQAGFGFDF